MKLHNRIITAGLVLVMLSGVLAGCKKDPPLDVSNNPFLMTNMTVGSRIDAATDETMPCLLGAKPSFAALATPYDTSRTDEDAIRILAVQMYNDACLRDLQATQRATYSYVPTHNVAMNMDNQVLLNIYEIKNGNEYYRIDYRLKKDIPLFNALPTAERSINNMLELVTTERRYMNTDMDTIKYEKILNASTNADGVPYANWSDTDKLTTKEEGVGLNKVFNNDIDIDYATDWNIDIGCKYQKSEFVINENTVDTATVAYNDVEGFYTIDVTLDCALVYGDDIPEGKVTDKNNTGSRSYASLGYNEATELTRAYIQDGAGTDNVAYTSIHITMEVWDSGHFKTYSSVESWEGTLNIFSIGVSSDFLYYDVYSYDEENCNISKYYTNDDFVDDYNATT